MNSAAPTPAPPDPRPRTPDIDYRKCFQHLARLAHTLGEAELRVLIELTNRTATSPTFTCAIGARQLAKAIGIAYSNVQAAVAGLTARALITVRPGAANRPSVYQVNIWLTTDFPISTGAPVAGAPLHSQQVHPCTCSRCTPAPVTGAPPTENQQFALLETSVDSDRSIPEGSIDCQDPIERTIRTKPSEHTAQDLEAARALMYGYRRKFPPLEEVGTEPHPPDREICARFLAVAPLPQLERLISDLFCERRTCGYSYAWFVSVALQRIHGISPKVAKHRKTQLAAVPRPVDADNDAGSDFPDLLQQLARTKAL
jgi:hypothetical protein